MSSSYTVSNRTKIEPKKSYVKNRKSDLLPFEGNFIRPLKKNSCKWVIVRYFGCLDLNPCGLLPQSSHRFSPEVNPHLTIIYDFNTSMGGQGGWTFFDFCPETAKTYSKLKFTFVSSLVSWITNYDQTSFGKIEIMRSINFYINLSFKFTALKPD